MKISRFCISWKIGIQQTINNLFKKNKNYVKWHPHLVPTHMQSLLGQLSVDLWIVLNGICRAASAILAFKADKLECQRVHVISKKFYNE